jgi:hypothetical protein
MKFSIGPPSHMLPITPTTPIIYGNGTMLSDIGEVTEAESTPGRKLPGPAERRMLKQQQANASLRSSPTIGYNGVLKRSKTGTHERKVSVESTSTITSEGQAAELFKDFDDGVSVDDSNFQGDDEESVADSYTEGVIASETERLARREGNIGDEDQSSSAALSRRAEQILLNAKKRLNVRLSLGQSAIETLLIQYRIWRVTFLVLEVLFISHLPALFLRYTAAVHYPDPLLLPKRIAV